mgnify:CR=1
MDCNTCVNVNGYCIKECAGVDRENGINVRRGKAKERNQLTIKVHEESKA